MRALVLAAAVASLVTTALPPVAEAARGTVVFVCGQDLCRVGDGKQSRRLTRDGARAGGYSRPSLSVAGTRLAYRRGRQGRVHTARLTRRGLTSFDYRRYLANVDGSAIRQVAASGGRPFVAFFDTTQIMREGLTDAFDARAEGQSVDQGLCVPDPESEQNGTCGDTGPQVAYDPQGRHLRHPAVAPNGRMLVATAHRTDETIDNAPDHAGALVHFDPRTAAPVRELTKGPGDSYASFAPDSRSVVFERDGAVFSVPVGAGTPRRIVRGRQPTWGR